MYLGIDIGGTAVKYGIIDENFNIIEKASFPTKKDSDSELLNDICSAVNSFSSKYDFPYVGIGSPGYVDNKNGIIYGTSNLPFKKTKSFLSLIGTKKRRRHQLEDEKNER